MSKDQISCLGLAWLGLDVDAHGNRNASETVVWPHSVILCDSVKLVVVLLNGKTKMTVVEGENINTKQTKTGEKRAERAERTEQKLEKKKGKSTET